MGKKRPKKGSKNFQDTDDVPSPRGPENGKRYKNTYLIDPETYDSLADEMLRKPPPDRNVFVSMKDYQLVDICPSYKHKPDAPTNLLLFCMRLIRNNTFQPIAALQRYDDEDQSYVIAQCLKAIIQDLASLGLHVLATVSPPTAFFCDILRHLVEIPELYLNTNPITYCAEPFREILHLYDIDSLVNMFQQMFYISENVCFISENQLRCAKWQDVYDILAANGVDSYITGSSGKSYNIFSQQFQMDMAQAFEKGNYRISQATYILINSVFKFANLKEIERSSIDLLTGVYNSLGDLKLALATLRFRNLQKASNPFAARSIEIANAEMNTIMETIDKSIEDDQHKKSLVNVVKDHLTEHEKIILKNDYGLEFNNSNSNKECEILTVELFNEPKKKPKNSKFCLKHLSISMEDNNNNYYKNKANSNNQDVKDTNVDVNTPSVNLKTEIANRIRTGKFNKNDLEEIMIRIEEEDNEISPSTRNYLHFLKYGCNDKPKNGIDLRRESHCKRQLVLNNKMMQKKDVNANIQNLDLIKSKLIRRENFYKNNNPQNEVNLMSKPDHTYFTNKTKSNNGNAKDKNVNVDNKIRTKLDHVDQNRLDNALNQITEDNDTSIDAQDYIDLLKQNCKDEAKTEVNSEPNIEVYSEMLNSLQDSYIAHHITNDWLSTIQGLPKLKSKLISRRVREFVPMSLALIHSDYFICFLKRAKLTSPKFTVKINFHVPDDMAILDCNAAIAMMANYLYLIKKN